MPDFLKINRLWINPAHVTDARQDVDSSGHPRVTLYLNAPAPCGVGGTAWPVEAREVTFYREDVPGIAAWLDSRSIVL